MSLPSSRYLYSNPHALNQLCSHSPRLSLSARRFLYIPPWFSAIDISLSFTTMMMPVPSSEASSSPSKASPPDSEPSPIMAMIFSLVPFTSRAFCRPVARLMDVEVWPTSKLSYSGHSAGEEYPDMAFISSTLPRNPAARPVNTLCG